MSGKKEGVTHGIRPLKGGGKKIHVQIDCDKCHRTECVSVYEDRVEDTEFKLSFFECLNCKKTFCAVCVKDGEQVECPFCTRLKPKKVKPFDIYVCGICFTQWWREGGFCNKCFYNPKDEVKDDGTYKGPTHLKKD